MKYQTNSSLVFTHGGGDPAGGHEDADADDEEEEEDGRGHRRRRRARAALAPPPPVRDRRCGRRSHRRAAAPLPRPPLPRLGDESPVFPPGPSDSAPWKRWTGWAVASLAGTGSRRHRAPGVAGERCVPVDRSGGRAHVGCVGRVSQVSCMRAPSSQDTEAVRLNQ